MYIVHIKEDVYEFQYVGYSYPDDKARQDQLDKFIKEHRDNNVIGIACMVPSFQKEGIKFLEDNGFKRIGKPSYNTNHAPHMNIIFARNFKKQTKARKRVSK